jgi:hypothetical protein
MSFRSAQLIRKGFNSAFSMVLYLGNKQASSGAEPPSQQVDAPSDAATALRECRVAWLPGRTNTNIHCELVQPIDKTLPNTPAFFYV